MYEDYLERDDFGFVTRAINEGYTPDDDAYNAIVPPISLSTSFQQQGPSQNKGFLYGRFGNPSRQMLEQCLSSLDNAKYALCFSSGLGATTAVLNLLSPGDHIVAGDDLYGGSHRLLSKVAGRLNIQTNFVDFSDLSNVEQAITKETKLIWLESPTNPLLKITDIAKVSEIAHQHENAITMNHFSCLQKPLSLGADIVMYSLTKYMNGHGDVVMGSVAVNDLHLYEKLKFLQNIMGIVPSPFDCYLVNRSLKTLALRMEQHMKSSMAVGLYLESHPQVDKVLHPGLPSHPQHTLLKKQCYGYSGMISFYIKGGLHETKIFLASLKIIRHGGSLGNYTSQAMIPALMTHTALTPEERTRLGITDNLIRMSVGLEAKDDIIADISQALQAIREQNS
ncbi:L-methionine gamma-lyase [Gryllus bimaculatus]|nr:L-methionine gamma-lyase [Gryllus bimaculatus]